MPSNIPLAVPVHCACAGNGLLLPFVMRFNLPAKTKVFAHVAHLLGENIIGLGEQGWPPEAVSAVEKHAPTSAIPARLRDIGIKPEQLHGLAEKTFPIKRILRCQPAARGTLREEIEGIFKAAYSFVLPIPGAIS